MLCSRVAGLLVLFPLPVCGARNKRKLYVRNVRARPPYPLGKNWIGERIGRVRGPKNCAAKMENAGNTCHVHASNS